MWFESREIAMAKLADSTAGDNAEATAELAVGNSCMFSCGTHAGFQHPQRSDNKRRLFRFSFPTSDGN